MPLFALVAGVLTLDLLWATVGGDRGSLLFGLVDEPAHLATCAAALLVARLVGVRLAATFVLAALLGSVAIDLDHAPGYLGWDGLIGTMPRPYSHSLLTPALLAGLGFLLKGSARSVLFGLAFGTAAHLVRDVATGGVPLAWPASDAVVAAPYPLFALGLGLTALLALPRAVARIRLAAPAAAALGVLVAVALALPSGASAFRIATGAYIPGVEEDPSLIDSYAAKVGRPPVIVSLYRNWEHDPFEAEHLEEIAVRGAAPMVTWEPWDSDERGISLWSIANGELDHYIATAARSAAAWGQPLFLRFAHEMNGNWYPWGWGVDSNTPAAFKAAWRRVVDIFRAAGAANVRWVWCPYVSNVRPRQFARFYPGDRWVDWACLDGFNWGSYRGWQSFKEVFALSYQRLVRVTSRPIMIGETGVNQNGGDKSDWISHSLRRNLPRYKHVRALIWWSEADHRADFRVDSSEQALAAVRGAYQRPLFAANRDVLLATPPRLRAERLRKKHGRRPPRNRRLRERRRNALLSARSGPRPISLGAFIPGAEREPQRIAAYARKVGRSPLIVGAYKDWGNRPFEPRELDGVWRNGAVPMVTWEPWGYGLRAIARGRYDRYVRASARAAARWGRPIFLRFAHEMNGDWYPWGKATSARTYKAAWRHLVRVFRRAGADNVRWVWTPHVNPSWDLPFAGRFPGDRWVDWVGLDGMNWGGSSPWRSFKELFGGSYRKLRRLSSRPVMLAEVACGEAGGSKSRWVAAALRRHIPRMKRLRAVLWWSENDYRADMRVDSSRGALRSLRRGARVDRYASSRHRLLRLP